MGPINFDLRPLFYFAVFGMVSAAIALMVGGGWLIWFIINHVRIV